MPGPPVHLNRASRRHRAQAAETERNAISSMTPSLHRAVEVAALPGTGKTRAGHLVPGTVWMAPEIYPLETRLF
jgi:hypothetical protein